LVCLLVLTSSAFGGSGYGGGYGSASIPQLPKLLSLMRDKTVQQPFLPTIPVATQGYGQQLQPQPITTDWSSSIMQQQQQQPITTGWTSSIMQQQQDIPIQQKIQGGYGTSFPASTIIQKTLPVQNYGQVNQGYGAMPFTPQFDQQQVQPVQPVQQVQILTEADTLCRGQQAETIIPLENGRKFVVCLDDGKGVEQQCPKGLFYHQQSGRCERKLGPLENHCVSQPCLNGGQCAPAGSTYQCQCASGFDGKTCELDARVCQTQQPCGQSPDTKCQSFRLGAALQHICIFQDGLAYGLNAQQVQPSPCQGVDGPHALAVTNNGFIICDGERMFVESCPGGTVWDDINKACVWPDMQTPTQLDQQQGYGQSSYSPQQKTIIKPYGGQWPVPQMEQPKQIQSYGGQWPAPQLELPKPVQSSGGQWSAQSSGGQWPVQSSGGQWSVPPIEQPKPVQSSGGQWTAQSSGGQWPVQSSSGQWPVQSSGGQWSVPPIEQPKPVQSSGGQWTVPQMEQPKPVPSYGGQVNIPQSWEKPKLDQSYGGQISIPLPWDQSKLVQSYGSQQQKQQQDNLVSVKQSSGY
jgi:hypothetical protein